MKIQNPPKCHALQYSCISSIRMCGTNSHLFGLFPDPCFHTPDYLTFFTESLVNRWTDEIKWCLTWDDAIGNPDRPRPRRIANLSRGEGDSRSQCAKLAENRRIAARNVGRVDKWRPWWRRTQSCVPRTRTLSCCLKCTSKGFPTAARPSVKWSATSRNCRRRIRRRRDIWRSCCYCILTSSSNNRNCCWPKIAQSNLWDRTRMR